MARALATIGGPIVDSRTPCRSASFHIGTVLTRRGADFAGRSGTSVTIDANSDPIAMVATEVIRNLTIAPLPLSSLLARRKAVGPRHALMNVVHALLYGLHALQSFRVMGQTGD